MSPRPGRLLQGLAYLSTVFHWPAQLQRPATTAFLVCLPIALVLAWYHGDRGHQRVGGRELAILTLLLLLGGGLFWWVGRLPDIPVVTAAGPSTAPAQIPATTGTSIAVLPFVNMSDDKPQRVLLRRHLRGTAERAGAGGRPRRGLAHFVLRATRAARSARRRSPARSRSATSSKAACASRGNKVRITAQLIDAVERPPPVVRNVRPRADRHLRHPGRDRQRDRRRAARQLGTAKVGAAGDGARRHGKHAGLRAVPEGARAFIARSDLPESIRLFERVTRMDPKFARGWEGLAAVSSVAPSWGDHGPRLHGAGEAGRRARAGAGSDPVDAVGGDRATAPRCVAGRLSRTSS